MSTPTNKNLHIETTTPDTTTTQGVEVLTTTTTGVVPGMGTATPVGGRQRDIWRIITRNPKVLAGLIIVALYILVAIIGPLFVHGDPNAFIGSSFDPPSSQFWLGTTQTGQDVLAQLLAGTRSSVFWGLVTGIAVTALSTAIGPAAGYFGGTVDDIISLLINIFLVLPGFPLQIVLAAYFPFKGDLTISLVIIFTGWAYNARVVRAQTMSMRDRDFVQAARANGESAWRILFTEILPNEIAIVMAALMGTIIYVILTTAGLEFLGLGSATSLSWGTMLYWVQNNDAIIQGAYWWFIPPILCIAILGVGLIMINYGIDEVANPRLRKEAKIKIKAQKSDKKAVA